jgi:hypothetical protein
LLGAFPALKAMRSYEVRPNGDNGGVDLISDAVPFGPLCCGGPDAVVNAVWYAPNPGSSMTPGFTETYERAAGFSKD